jgi:hypothetical protein
MLYLTPDMTEKDKKDMGKRSRLTVFLRIFSAVFGRLLLYGFLATALAAAIFSLYIQSHDFELLLADLIREGMEKTLGQPVTLRSLRIDPLGGRLLINGVTVGSGAIDLPSPLHLDHVILEVDSASMFRGELDIKRIMVLRPSIDVVFTADGRSNLPQLKQQEPGGLRVRIGRLDIYNGELIISGRAIGWGMDSGQIDIGVSRTDGGLRGNARLRRLRLALPELRSFTADLETGFKVGEDRIDGSAALLGEDGSSLQVEKWVFDLADGDFESDFKLQADIGLLNHPEFGDLSGRLESSGDVRYAGGELAVTAEAVMPELRIGGIKAERLRGRVNYQGGILSGELLEAYAFDGRMAGNAEIREIFENPVIKVKLDVDKFDLPSLLSAAGLGRIHLDGRLDGKFEFALDEANPQGMTLRGNIATNWRPGAEKAYKQAVEAISSGRELEVFRSTVIPIAVSGGFEYSGGVLSLAEDFSAKTPLSVVGINGKADVSHLDLVLRTRSVGSDEAALAVAGISRLLGMEEGPPEEQYKIASIVRRFETKGQAVLRIKGSLENPALDLRWRTEGVRYADRSFGGGTMRMEWAGGVLSFPQIKLRDGASVLDINGTIRFPQGREVESEFNITAVEFDLTGLESVIGIESVGLSGIAEGSLHMSITPELEGSGEVKTRSLTLGEIKFDRAQAEIEFGRRLVVRKLDAVGPNGTHVQGDIEFDTVSQDWRAALTAQGVRLDRYAELVAPDMEVRGLAELKIDASGHKLAASGLVDFSVTGAGIGGIAFGDIQGGLRADGRRGSLVVSYGDQSYRIEAELIGDSQREVQLSLEKEVVDLTPLAHEFIPDQRLYLQVLQGISGKVLLADTGLEAEMTLGRVQVGIEQFSASSVGPVRIRYAGDRLYFNDVRVEQSEYQLNASGSFSLNGSNNFSLDLDGGVNLLALSDFFTDFSFSGGAQVELSVRGTLSKPLVYGDVKLVDGFVRHKESNLSLAGVRGDVRIENERIEVDRVTALFSEGVVDLDGFVNVDWATLQPTSFQFNIEGSGVNYSIPQELSATLDASLILRGSLKDSILTGAIDVRNALYTKRYEPEAELLHAQQQPLPMAADELRNVRLDLALRGDEGIRVDNNFADMEVILDLRVLGTGAEPVITGRSEVKEGEVYYRDRKYTITSGVIDFVNPYRMEPHFDFRAETQVKEYRIFLEFHGTPDRLYPNLSSDPAESVIDILHLLAVGKVRDNPFPSDTERLQEQLLGLALSGFITRQVTGQLERRAERLFGIDRFRIDPFFPGGSNNLSPRVTVGEQITDRLSVIYSRNLSENAEQVLVFEYQLSPTMVLIGSREEDGSYAVDMHLKHSFR